MFNTKELGIWFSAKVNVSTFPDRDIVKSTVEAMALQGPNALNIAAKATQGFVFMIFHLAGSAKSKAIAQPRIGKASPNRHRSAIDL